MKTLLPLFVLMATGLSFGQTLHLKVESYDIESPIYSDRFLMGHLDAQGRLQGTFRSYYMYGNDTTCIFRGTMRDGVLVDTAYWYSQKNVVRRKAVFGGQGLSTEHVLDNGYDLGLPGVQHGPDLQWERTGQKEPYLVSAERYSNGKYDGPQMHYFENGRVRIQEEYRAGKKHGTYTENFPSGALHVVGNYADGFKKGPWHTFEEDGKQETNWYDGLKDYPDSTHHYAADKKTLEERELFTDKNTVAHSIYERGVLVRTFDSRYSMMNGKEITYYPNGQKRTEVVYEYDDPIGSHKSWYPNGQQKEEYVQQWDGREGAYRSWYENGRLKAKGQYSEGVKTGVWEHYSPTGKKIAKPTPEMEWDEESVEVARSIEVVEEGPFQDRIYTYVEVLPSVGFVSGKELYSRDLSKERTLKFLRRYKTIHAEVSVNGWKTTYKVLTPMEKEQAKLLEDYLAREFSWTQLERFGRRLSCKVNLVLEIDPSRK
jgi:antitoxin component YwqK of YwqJK toxin-antitoxin module